MGYYKTSVRPLIDKTEIAAFHAAAMTVNDVLFDWTALKIPKKGGAKLLDLSYLSIGIDDTADEQGFLFLFAKNNKVSIGTPHAAATGLIDRDQIIGSCLVTNNDDTTGVKFGPDQNYRFCSASISNPTGQGIVTLGDADSSDVDTTTNPGYITIYFAVIALETTNISTGVTLNQAGNQAATTVATTLTTAGTPANECLRVGDILIAGDEAEIGTVTAVTNGTTVVVDKVTSALANSDEIYVQNPFVFQFGFEV
tara:strand:+ start:39 stop:800 length:762 start_codon:yes stop_codon:yes gene_type:complete